jgi:hypothetical protein
LFQWRRYNLPIHTYYICHYTSIFWVGIPKTEYISYVLVLIMGDDLGSEDVPNVRQFVDHLLFDKVHDYYIPTTLRNIINIIKHMKLKSQNIQIYNSKKKLQITRLAIFCSTPFLVATWNVFPWQFASSSWQSPASWVVPTH